MVRCNIHSGKYCKEPYCNYIFHQQEAKRWLEIWKNKVNAELLEYKKKKIIGNKLVTRRQ